MFLLPENECLLCLEKSAGELLCPLCIEQLPRFDKDQRTSHISLNQGSLTKVPPLEVYSLFRYDWPVANMQHRFKYHRDYDTGRALSELFAEQFAVDTDLSDDWRLLPVPMHWRRVWQRRGNHTIFMAKIIARHIAMPIDIRTIRLTRNPQQQAKLDQKQRERNVKQLYKCRQQVKNKRFLLLDDIVTTGNTMSALARLLYSQGADQVRGASISRGELH